MKCYSGRPEGGANQVLTDGSVCVCVCGGGGGGGGEGLLPETFS